MSRNPLFLMMSIFASTPLVMSAADHGSWCEYDKTGLPVCYEWFGYTAIDEEMRLRHLEVIPIYARAMAKFQMEQIGAFRLLDAGERLKRPAYESIPSEITEENCIPFFEAALLSEYESEVSKLEGASLEAQKYLVTVKDSDGALLGFTHFILLGDQAQLEPLMIDPGAQGRGLARQLIFSIFKIDEIAKKIFLCTNAKNTKAAAVYRHLGFFESSRVKTDKVNWEYGIGIIFEIFRTPN